MNISKNLKPPFDEKSARLKVRAAEDAWNSRNPERVASAYSLDSIWRNREQFIKGRKDIQDFLSLKWQGETEYRLAKDLWSFSENRIAVRFQYEYKNQSGQWFRAYGNELWEFDEEGLMRRREASINDVAILSSDRLFHWPLGQARPTDHEGI